MPSRYSIMQFYPDLIRGECVNVGVVAFDETGSVCVGLKNWERAEAFTGHSLDMIRESVADYVKNPPTEEQMDATNGRVYATVHFTRPRGSLTSRDELLEKMAKTFLVER